MKGVFEIPQSPTRSSTSKMRRVLLKESEQMDTGQENYASVLLNASYWNLGLWAMYGQMFVHAECNTTVMYIKAFSISTSRRRNTGRSSGMSCIVRLQERRKSLLKLALRALCQGLSFQETFSEAPLKRVLLPIRYVFVLQYAVQIFHFKPLVTCQETLQDEA